MSVGVSIKVHCTKGNAIVKTYLFDCSDGWLALDISHSCRKARRQGKAMIKVQVLFLLHPRFSFACLFLVNFDSSDQVTGLAATVGKVSRQAFLQLAEGVQVASLDLTQTQPFSKPTHDLCFRHELVVLSVAGQAGFAKKTQQNAASAAPLSTSHPLDGTSFSHQEPLTSSSARFV